MDLTEPKPLACIMREFEGFLSGHLQSRNTETQKTSWFRCLHAWFDKVATVQTSSSGDKKLASWRRLLDSKLGESHMRTLSITKQAEFAGTMKKVLLMYIHVNFAACEHMTVM